MNQFYRFSNKYNDQSYLSKKSGIIDKPTWELVSYFEICINQRSTGFPSNVNSVLLFCDVCRV